MWHLVILAKVMASHNNSKVVTLLEVISSSPLLQGRTSLLPSISEPCHGLQFSLRMLLFLVCCVFGLNLIQREMCIQILISRVFP